MACIICQEAAGEEVLSNLAKCSECGLIYYDNTSNSSTLSDLYQESYFNGEEYLNYKNDKPIIQKNFNSRLNEIKKYAQRGSLFEIGCAYGFFLELAKENFSVGGIDITEEPTRFAREELGLKVTSGNYLEQDLKEKKDVFCMWDTIEHLERPEEFIKKVSSEIRQGGYFFLTTGDIGSLLAKVRGKKWRMIHPPTHLFYFSQKTIKKLLEKNGFEIVSIKHPGVHRSFRQVLYSILFLNKKNTPKKLEKILNKIDFPIYLNTFDIMMVTARKK